MENKKMGKFDIDIEVKDLLWQFVRSWRVFVCLMLAGGIVLGAYQYRIDKNTTDVVVVKQTQEELEQTLGTQDLDEVTAAVALKRQLDQKSAYMETSELMRMNPYEENAVFLQYYIQAETENTAQSAGSIYTAYIEHSILAQRLMAKELYDADTEYVAELISLVTGDSVVYINVQNANESIELKTPDAESAVSFTVKITGIDAENIQKLAGDVKTALQECSFTISETVGTHQLVLLDEISGIVVDHELAELQNRNATAIKTISNNLDGLKNEMTGEQISLYVYRTTVLAEENNQPVNEAAEEKTVSISVKHVAIGAVIGVVLAGFIVFVLYLFAAALRNAEEVKTLYRIKVLGCIDDTAFNRKKLFGFVDRFIFRLQNLRKKTLTFEQEVQMAGANILLNCKALDCKEVYLTGSDLETIPVEIVNEVTRKCEEKGIRIVKGNNISYDAEALERAADMGNVVFIEKKGISLYDELYREVALCREHDINIIGMIVIGV